MKKKLTSRKFIVTLASIAGVLATPGLGKPEKAIIAALAVVYLIIEGWLDYKGLPAKDGPPSFTTNVSIAPPSSGAFDVKAIAETVTQAFEAFNGHAQSSGPKRTPRPSTPTSEPPKTLPGVGEEPRNV